ncbi:MAG: ethanolamine ammonia-lyase subunit EutC [Rubrimonas sp.]
MTAGADRWRGLTRFTPARIALGRTGISLPTARALEFQAAHAAARTAVHAPFDAEAMAAALGPGFPGALTVESRAGNRAVYLQRPDLGRRLAAISADRLAAAAPDPGSGPDVAVVVCDGLSALAVERNAAPFLAAFLPRVARHGWTLAPLVVAREGRVALGDEAGELLRARLVLLLIGERPGLSAADSLGLYITHGPRVGLTDADRNCISNVRDGGLTHADAAYRAEYLIAEALRRGLSGVALKDDTVAPAEAVEGAAVPRLPVL